MQSLDKLSRKEIASGLSESDVQKLSEFFGRGIRGAEQRIRSFSIPEGLTREALLRYKVIAQKAIAEGRDTQGVQKLRLGLVDKALSELPGLGT